MKPEKELNFAQVQTRPDSPHGGLLVACSIVAVFALGIHSDDNSRGSQSMRADEIDDLKKQFASKPEFGFLTRYGRTGRIESVDGETKTLQVITPKGSFAARVGAATVVLRSSNKTQETLTFSDLTPGTLVTVEGPLFSESGDEATIVEVIPTGIGGFSITPSEGHGPHAVPIFP